LTILPISVENVIVSTRASQPLDIELLASKLSHIIYEPEVFCGLVYRREVPKATITMFSTGKITSTGSKSERTARESLHATASEIVHLTGKSIALRGFKTENVVATASVGYPIDVEKFVRQHSNTTYEPGQFPGAFCRLREAVVLLFASGKVVTVGAKSESEASSSIQQVYRMLREFGCFLIPLKMLTTSRRKTSEAHDRRTIRKHPLESLA
jgi:transcription initiation factor TFIID TATA-box-binding protein